MTATEVMMQTNHQEQLRRKILAELQYEMSHIDHRMNNTKYLERLVDIVLCKTAEVLSGLVFQVQHLQDITHTLSALKMDKKD